jgi:hypothetical protein
MEKSHGATLGTVVLAALLLRPGPSSAPEPKETGNPTTTFASLQSKGVSGDGPWVASCEYWAPERLASYDPTRASPSKFTFESEDPRVNLTLRAAVSKDERDCVGDPGRWGVPRPEGGRERYPKPKITAIIATVPDPIRTNLALQFDWTIDALIDAAADNNYVTSYYWLPWNNKPEKNGDKEQTGEGRRGEQEREPGLLILKPIHDDDSSISGDLHSALYLFFVGETPTSGINAYQMERAFEYEDVLATTGADFSRSLKKNSDRDGVDIIGPVFTSSAASLRRSIDYELKADPHLRAKSAPGKNGVPQKKPVFVGVNGATAARIAEAELNVKTSEKPDVRKRTSCLPLPQRTNAADEISYQSFEQNSDFSEGRIVARFHDSNVPESRVALLIEDGTRLGEAYSMDTKNYQGDVGNESQSKEVPKGAEHDDDHYHPIVIKFPREISLLRNAQIEDSSKEGTAPPSPYLRLSLKDSNAYDGVPHFSREDTPLLQESQVMAITRQLQRYRAVYVVISATNPLDQLYLARALHRGLPDARLVFDGANSLFVRDVDDQPFIGSVSFGAYHLMGLGSPTKPGFGGRAFPGIEAISYYNATSDAFWDGKHGTHKLRLAGYVNPLNPAGETESPPLWMTVIGSDGYYPLGIVESTATGNGSNLPTVAKSDLDLTVGSKFPLYPSLAWSFLCSFIILLCVLHVTALCWAEFWSPATRDLALKENDQPFRRSLYIRVGAVMLWSMAWVTATPIFFSGWALIEWHWAGQTAGVFTLLAGAAVIAMTRVKTKPYIKAGPPKVTSFEKGSPPTKTRLERSQSDAAYYRTFHAVTWSAFFLIPATWFFLCYDSLLFRKGSGAGRFFAYRCLHPQSGISPLMPVVLLLAGWYAWSVSQALRLRFSDCNRPVLPGCFDPKTSNADAKTAYPLYVFDEALEYDNLAWTGCLYRNITCLLITREVILRFVRQNDKEGKRSGRTDWLLILGYLLLFALFVFLPVMHSVDRLFLARFWLSPYEYLLRALFFPLLVIAVTGCLRMVFVWGALKRGLLDALEMSPIRYAFDRLKDSGWKSMFRQSSLREQWRDMARSTESARQLAENPGLRAYAENKERQAAPLRPVYEKLDHNIRALMDYLGGQPIDQTAPGLAWKDEDRCGMDPAIQDSNDRIGLRLMHAIETNYADFAKVLLEYILIPRWKNDCRSFVQSEVAPELCESLLKCLGQDAIPDSGDGDEQTPHCVQLAEEFVAIRYVALIRTVMVNLRYLMTFVTVAFVLAIVAWNSYPFEPRDLVNWLFTLLLLFLGLCIIGVFAQMHRDPILSRITDKRPNELGLDFYIRVASFGAVPVLTWLAYNYPQIGGTLYKLFQPGGGGAS